jgi:hypothetical protein
MVTHDGKPFTDKDLLGKWSLIYFESTNCSDICPEELDKMSAAVTELGAHLLLRISDFALLTHCVDKTYGPIVQPIFISVDPARDSPPNGPSCAGLPASTLALSDWQVIMRRRRRRARHTAYISRHHQVPNQMTTISSTTPYLSISWTRTEISSMPLESPARGQM